MCRRRDCPDTFKIVFELSPGYAGVCRTPFALRCTAECGECQKGRKLLWDTQKGFCLQGTEATSFPHMSLFRWHTGVLSQLSEVHTRSSISWQMRGDDSRGGALCCQSRGTGTGRFVLEIVIVGSQIVQRLGDLSSRSRGWWGW